MNPAVLEPSPIGCRLVLRPDFRGIVCRHRDEFEVLAGMHPVEDLDDEDLDEAEDDAGDDEDLDAEEGACELLTDGDDAPDEAGAGLAGMTVVGPEWFVTNLDESC